MPGKPIGSNVYLYLDCFEDLDIGDLVVTGTLRTYRITSVRVQTRGMRIGRQHVRADVVDHDEAMAEREDEKVVEIAWYKRG